MPPTRKNREAERSMGPLENDVDEPQQHGESQTVHDLSREPAQCAFIVVFLLIPAHYVVT